MTKTELAEVLARLGAAYRAPIGDDQLRVWWEVNGDLDASEALDAARWFTTSEEQMPTPARFRSRILGERRARASEVSETRGLEEDTSDLTPPDVAIPRIQRIREEVMAKTRMP